MMTCDGGHGYVKCSEQQCCNVVVWMEILLLVVYQLDGLVAVLFVGYSAIHCGG